MWRYFIRIIFISVGLGLSSTSAQNQVSGLDETPLTRAKDDGTTGSCIKTCKTVEDCTCQALEKVWGDKKDFVLRKCDNNFCSYCVKGDHKCGVGPIKKKAAVGGYFECCSALGSPEENKRQVSCRAILDSPSKDKVSHFQCKNPCDYAAYKYQNDCVDRTGRDAGGLFYSCKGSKPNTLQVCKKAGKYKLDNTPVLDYYLPMDCGTVGASCTEKSDCCGNYFCEDKTCKLYCLVDGEKCQKERRCCSGVCDTDKSTCVPV